MQTTKTVLKQLEQVLHLLEGPGSACDYGCPDDRFYWAIQTARRANPRKPIRIVKDWSWLEIEYDERMLGELTTKGLQPIRIKADSVLLDETKTYEQDHWLISSHLVDFRENYIFETEEITYILACEGTAKTVTPESLQFFIGFE